MREQDVRERIASYLRRRLFDAVMPPALGLALSAGCSHAQPKPDSTAAIEPDDAVQGDLQRPDGVLIYSSVMPARPRTKFNQLDGVVARMWSALEQADLSFLEGAILSHADYAALVRRPPDEATYQKMVGDWLAIHGEEFRKPPVPGRWRAGRSHIDDVYGVEADDHWTRRLNIAVSTYEVHYQEGTSFTKPKKLAPMILVHLADRWRILVKDPE
jgi:hypothetical protein